MDDIRNQSISILTRVLRDQDSKLRDIIEVDCGTDSDRFISLADDYKEAVIFQDVTCGYVMVESMGNDKDIDS
jgi:hypothetical protein